MGTPYPPPNMPPDTAWRLLEIHRESKASMGKAQSRFATTLLVFLTVLWGTHFAGPDGFKLNLIGVEIQATFLWTIAPFVLMVANLGLIATLNAMLSVFARLVAVLNHLGVVAFWSDLDTNKNVLDFIPALAVKPMGFVEPVTIPPTVTRKGQVSPFIYPLIIAAAAATTLLADYTGATVGRRVYIYACFVLQCLFAFRPWYRAFCMAFGWREDELYRGVGR